LQEGKTESSSLLLFAVPPSDFWQGMRSRTQKIAFRLSLSKLPLALTAFTQRRGKPQDPGHPYSLPLV